DLLERLGQLTADGDRPLRQRAPHGGERRGQPPSRLECNRRVRPAGELVPQRLQRLASTREVTEELVALAGEAACDERGFHRGGHPYPPATAHKAPPPGPPPVPSSARTMRPSSPAGASAPHATTSRDAGSRNSKAATPKPPPTTIASGLNMLTSEPMPAPSRWPMPARMSRAVTSPSRASRTSR